MSTIPARTTAEIALRTVETLLLAGGAGALLSGMGVLPGRRGRRPDKPSRRRVIAGVAMLVAGLLVWGWLRASQLDRPADVISSTRFSSSKAPILSLDAPVGWQLSHEPDTGRLRATGPGAALMLETSRIVDGVNPEGFVRKMAARATAGGAATDVGTFEETLDRFPAWGVSYKYRAGGSAAWYVPRGGPLVTTIYCKVDSTANARDACRAVLSTLRWRAPGPL